MKQTRRLLLSHLYNVRELGGYATVDGGRTRFGVFLRSDAPCDLTPQDIAHLTDYGMTGTMDLRGPGEKKARPSSLKERMTYYDQSLISDSAVYGAAPPVKPEHSGGGWGERYIEMAESAKAWAIRALTDAANHPGVLLYHCTTGKDRTGLLTCYLLSIAGVPEEDIIADYCVSELYLEPVYIRMRANEIPMGAPAGSPPPLDEGFFHTPAAAMRTLLQHMDTTYGGVVAYLRQIGLPEAVFSALRAKLVED